MSRSFWAAVGAGVFVLTLGLVAALAASPSAPVQPATTNAKSSYPVPIVHHIAVVHTPALAHPKQHTTQRPRRAARPAVTQRHLVVLAPGSGYQQVAGSGQVRTLQRRLTALGFAPGPVDGRYGPRTTRAVERFQHARRLTVNGIVDARTQRALRPVTRPARTTRPANHPAHPHPAAQPQPAPEGNPARVSPAHHQPGLPVTLVLLALAALGLATILLSYRRTRVRARHQPAHGEHTSTRVPELITTHDTNPGEREEQR
jgi:Putative peptidoglycan binding domain